jgi:hypothetical protein
MGCGFDAFDNWDEGEKGMFIFMDKCIHVYMYICIYVYIYIDTNGHV